MANQPITMNKIKQISKNHTLDRGTKQISSLTQLPVQLWYVIIGDQTLADAILDKIVHDAHRLELQGDSLRRKRKTEEQKV